MTAARAITCPNCGGSIAVKAAGYSVSVGCEHCGALLDVAHPDVVVIEQYEHAMQDLPLALGRRGALFGREWETIGALARTDGDVAWTETLLFNPYAGYRWLVLSEGEWTFGTMVLDRPDGTGANAQWRGERYHRDYDPVTTTTTSVVGEFYWRARAGDTVTATTFSRGNEQLSAEWGDDEVNWTQLVPVSRAEVMQAFGPPAGGGRPGGSGPKGMAQGFAADQADIGSADDEGLVSRLGAAYDEAEGMTWEDVPRMFLLGLATVIASLLVMMAFGMSTDRVQSRTSAPVDGPERSLTVGQLTIGRPYQVVSLTARAEPFENRWVDIDYTLVNVQTQRAYTAYGVVEHYAGSDSDGPWTEGDYVTVTKLSAIPRGTYYVMADLQAHAWTGSNYASSSPASGSSWAAPETIDVSISAAAGGIMWSNLVLEMVLLLGLPVVILWWRHG